MRDLNGFLSGQCILRRYEGDRCKRRRGGPEDRRQHGVHCMVQAFFQQPKVQQGEHRQHDQRRVYPRMLKAMTSGHSRSLGHYEGSWYQRSAPTDNKSTERSRGWTRQDISTVTAPRVGRTIRRHELSSSSTVVVVVVVVVVLLLLKASMLPRAHIKVLKQIVLIGSRSDSWSL